MRHQEKPPSENYLQFGGISFLLSKEGQFEAIGGNIPQFSIVGIISSVGWFASIEPGALMQC
jgi:hypothetical protein